MGDAIRVVTIVVYDNVNLINRVRDFVLNHTNIVDCHPPEGDAVPLPYSVSVMLEPGEMNTITWYHGEEIDMETEPSLTVGVDGCVSRYAHDGDFVETVVETYDELMAEIVKGKLET